MPTYYARFRKNRTRTHTQKRRLTHRVLEHARPVCSASVPFHIIHTCTRCRSSGSIHAFASTDQRERFKTVISAHTHTRRHTHTDRTLPWNRVHHFRDTLRSLGSTQSCLLARSYALPGEQSSVSVCRCRSVSVPVCPHVCHPLVCVCGCMFGGVWV